jgi:hypothetical protein
MSIIQKLFGFKKKSPTNPIKSPPEQSEAKVEFGSREYYRELVTQILDELRNENLFEALIDPETDNVVGIKIEGADKIPDEIWNISGRSDEFLDLVGLARNYTKSTRVVEPSNSNVLLYFYCSDDDNQLADAIISAAGFNPEGSRIAFPKKLTVEIDRSSFWELVCPSCNHAMILGVNAHWAGFGDGDLVGNTHGLSHVPNPLTELHLDHHVFSRQELFIKLSLNQDRSWRCYHCEASGNIYPALPDKD